MRKLPAKQFWFCWYTCWQPITSITYMPGLLNMAIQPTPERPLTSRDPWNLDPDWRIGWLFGLGFPERPPEKDRWCPLRTDQLLDKLKQSQWLTKHSRDSRCWFIHVYTFITPGTTSKPVNLSSWWIILVLALSSNEVAHKYSGCHCPWRLP